MTNRSLVGTLLTTDDEIFQHTLPYCQIIEWFEILMVLILNDENI